MSLGPHPRRFDPRWLSQAARKGRAEASEKLNAPPRFTPGESTADPAKPEFDEALAQVASEGLTVFPLCEGIEPALLCTQVRSLASQAHRVLTGTTRVRYEEWRELRQQLVRLRRKITRLRRLHSLRCVELQRWMDNLLRQVADRRLDEPA
jgi:hypothetical protein